MTRFLYLAVLLTLFGCATKPYQTTYSTEEVGKERYFEAVTPKNQTLSLQSPVISNEGLLKLNVVSITKQGEFEAPKMNRISKDRRPADPLGALGTTIFSAGLALLFAPVKTGSQLIGDTRSETVTSSYLDKSRATATGNSRWWIEPTRYSGQVSIEGIQESPLILQASGGEVDLSEHFKRYRLGNNLNIKISCWECQDAIPQQSNNYTYLTKVKTISYDLTSFRGVQEEKRILAIKDEQKKLGEKKAFTSTAQQKCARLGLTPGSSDYQLCIATQNKP